MSITSIFYTEQCQIVKGIINEPDEYGYIKTSYIIQEEPISCCITPISTNKAREVWGIQGRSTTEVSFDIGTMNIEDIKGVMINNELYLVENYTIYPQFMILEASVTLAVTKYEC